ncbi:TIGR03617 family F420-dependent LLM class oxidoreductase [Amycolatopsis pithecellobii]|uniref:TIGR03617 family F420-dependent LLM class oxidoreductase n=1 Tax=Amycolatopsis pithecellobii TaxID=664692 RepID=A0A6N7Z4H5_9PSEU|nr:TIGR03617 family F420-dependent LLM class oxidoreductase [Amycolatopsis pithecellobii]MTD57023.1 TIGR03617 family F420-dependent LLM class oxidoreductase [Amycolatopsis pithecellobii]
MKVDLYVYRPRLEEMAARARQVEAGFDGLFVAESTGDPFQALAVASQHLRDRVLGTSIALAFPRSPMVTAVSAWDLQRASGGRFVLGLGSQVRKHIERRFSSAFTPPMPRLREYVLAVRHVWGAFAGAHPLDFRGEYYTLDYLPPAMNPGPLDCGAPPVYLAALGPAMFEAAAEVGDGALVHPIHTHAYLREVAEAAIARGLSKADRRRDEFALSVTALCIVDEDTGDASREAVRRQFAFYASTPAYRPVLDLHGWGELGERLRQKVRHGEHDSMAELVPDEILDAFCVVAPTWPQAIAAAREKYAGVADRVMFQSAPAIA